MKKRSGSPDSLIQCVDVDVAAPVAACGLGASTSMKVSVGLNQNAATVRDLDSGEQELVPLTALRDRLEQFR